MSAESPEKDGNAAAAAPGGGAVRIAVVPARNEGQGIAQTIAALKRSMTGIEVFVGDDASTDGTAGVARYAGARVVERRGKPIGKGGNATAAARAALEWLEAKHPARPATVLLCDGDLRDSAAELARLVELVERDQADLAIAKFAVKAGGGFGWAKGFARSSIERHSGFVADAPISGQRAMTPHVLRDVLPFADGFGMEIGMTVDAVRAGYKVVEIELPLTHRATGKSIGGFVHRGRQLRDFRRVDRERATQT